MDDLLLDVETGDLLIQSNDFVIGDGNGQATQDILQTVPGEYKFYPYVGCDLWRYLNGSATVDEIKNTVKRQFELQLFTVFQIDVTFENDQLNVVPYCERV